MFGVRLAGRSLISTHTNNIYLLKIKQLGIISLKTLVTISNACNYFCVTIIIVKAKYSYLMVPLYYMSDKDVFQLL